jgi:hypothetical protein
MRNIYQQHIRRHNHELLESKTTTSMGTTVKDVHEWDREDVGLLCACEVGDVGIKRDSLVTVSRFSISSLNITYLLGSASLCDSHADTEDSISTKFSLVCSSIEIFQELVNLRLVLNIDVLLNERGSNNVVNVANGLGYTWIGPCISTVAPSLTCLGSYLCRPTWTCLHRGARKPHVNLQTDQPVVPDIFIVKSAHQWKLQKGQLHGVGQSR